MQDDVISYDHHLLIIHYHHLLRGAVTMLVDSKGQVVHEELQKMQGSNFLGAAERKLHLQGFKIASQVVQAIQSYDFQSTFNRMR